jgi:hypothetical protein
MCVRKDLWSVSCILIVSHLALLFDVDLSSAIIPNGLSCSEWW